MAQNDSLDQWLEVLNARENLDKAKLELEEAIRATAAYELVPIAGIARAAQLSRPTIYRILNTPSPPGQYVAVLQSGERLELAGETILEAHADLDRQLQHRGADHRSRAGLAIKITKDTT